MERIEEAVKLDESGDTVDYFELFDVQYDCDDPQKMAERRKANWQLHLHPDKFRHYFPSAEADVSARATKCFASLTALWEKLPEGCFQTQGLGLTRMQRSRALKMFSKQPGATRAPRPTPPPERTPPPSPEPPKQVAKSMLPCDPDKAMATLLLQRMMSNIDTADTRLIVRDMSTNVLAQQAVATVRMKRISFTGGEADVTAIEAEADGFLRGCAISEEQRTLARESAVRLYLENPQVAEQRKYWKAANEERAVADAKKQMLAKASSSISQSSSTSSSASGKLAIRTLDKQDDRQLLETAKATLGAVPEGADRAKLARGVVADIRAEASAVALQERHKGWQSGKLSGKLRQEIEAQDALDAKYNTKQEGEGGSNEPKVSEAAFERMKGEAVARTRRKELGQSGSYVERGERDRKKWRVREEARWKREEREMEVEDVKNRDLIEYQAVMSGAMVDKSKWTKNGWEVEKQEPDASFPVVQWISGPALPSAPPATAPRSITCGGTKFDCFADRPPSRHDGKIVSPAMHFLLSICGERGSKGERGAVKVKEVDGEKVLFVHSQRVRVGCSQVDAYVRGSLMPMVNVIETLRHREPTQRMEKGWVRKDGKEVAFEVGHTANGVARLRVEAAKKVDKVGGDEVRSYIESTLPYERNELALLFQDLPPVSMVHGRLRPDGTDHSHLLPSRSIHAARQHGGTRLAVQVLRSEGKGQREAAQGL